MAAKPQQSIEKLRAWWWRRQGLGSRNAKASVAAVFEQSGWARSVGGCGPYLTLFSRTGISREAVDQAVSKIEIHELPSARACTYVVPASDYSLALQLAQQFGSGDMRAAEKLGVTSKEIEKLCSAVLSALKNGPLTPEQIREATGSAARSLGPEGQKKGLSSTLPLALGSLQRAGDIRRVSTNGRIDNQRYAYALWQPNPIGKNKWTAEQANVELARRYFHWIAPASLADFQAFAGISGKAAKAAVEALKLEPFSDLLMPPASRSEFEAYTVPKDPDYRLVMSLDSILLLRRDIQTLVDPKDNGHPLLAKSFKAGGALAELPDPAILDRGRVVGLWQYDPETESIAYATFGKKPDSLLKKAVAETQDYIRTQLGDARTFSLDSPKSRIPRITALRES